MDSRTWFCSCMLVAGLAWVMIGCDAGEIPIAFPNHIGATWEYSVYDSALSRRDTVVVQVTESTVVYLPVAFPATILTLDYPDRREERYAVAKGDTLEIYEKTAGNTPGYMEARYVFPLRVGARWKVPPCGDLLMVAGIDRAHTYTGQFKGAYRLQIDTWCNNEPFLKTEWFVPGVGVVRRDLGSYQIDETWALISFSE